MVESEEDNKLVHFEPVYIHDDEPLVETLVNHLKSDCNKELQSVSAGDAGVKSSVKIGCNGATNVEAKSEANSSSASKEVKKLCDFKKMVILVVRMT
jgi:hypothetical protein